MATTINVVIALLNYSKFSIRYSLTPSNHSNTTILNWQTTTRAGNTRESPGGE